MHIGAAPGQRRAAAGLRSAGHSGTEPQCCAAWPWPRARQLPAEWVVRNREEGLGSGGAEGEVPRRYSPTYGKNISKEAAESTQTLTCSPGERTVTRGGAAVTTARVLPPCPLPRGLQPFPRPSATRGITPCLPDSRCPPRRCAEEHEVWQTPTLLPRADKRDGGSRGRGGCADRQMVWLQFLGNLG